MWAARVDSYKARQQKFSSLIGNCGFRQGLLHHLMALQILNIARNRESRLWYYASVSEKQNGSDDASRSQNEICLCVLCSFVSCWSCLGILSIHTEQ